MNRTTTTPHTLTITVSDSSCDDKIEISLNKYSHIDDWIKVFKTIMMHQTFSEDAIKELFEYDKTIEDYTSSFNTPPLDPWWNEPKPISTAEGKEA